MTGSVGNDFPALAADVAGNWYVAYSSLTKDGSQAWLASSSDGKSWREPVAITSGIGNALFPWIVAGDAGHVAIAWYGSATPGNSNDAKAMKDAVWNVEIATSFDALSAAPRFATARVTGSPMHAGTISTHGLDPTDPSAPDRSLGDFFTIALDPQGRVNVAYERSLDGAANLEWTRIEGLSLYASGAAPALPTPSSGLLPVTPPSPLP